MLTPIILILISGFLAIYVWKTQVFSWASPAIMVICYIVIFLSLVFLLINGISNFFLNYNINVNPLVFVLSILFVAYMFTAWATGQKNEVIVPKNFSGNYLVLVYNVKGAKKLNPELFRIPKTFRLKFPNSGVLKTSEKRQSNCYYYSMAEILDHKYNLFKPEKSSRHFQSVSKKYNGYDVDILFLNEESFFSTIEKYNYEEIIDRLKLSD